MKRKEKEIHSLSRNTITLKTVAIVLNKGLQFLADPLD